MTHSCLAKSSHRVQEPLKQAIFLLHFRVLQGREDQLVLLGPSEFQGDPALRDLQGLLERKGFL